MGSKHAGWFRSKNWLITLILVTFSAKAFATEEWFYLFLPADNPIQQGFARITNTSSSTGDVTITGIDDAGVTSSGSISITLAGGESVHFNSQDLENGNTSKGLSGSLGDGEGNWRLKLSSDLDLDIAGLFRNTSGFVNLLHATAPTNDDLSHEVNFFNPASNTNQVSRLRIINTSNSTNSISITGVDDSGTDAGPVTFSIPAQQAMEINADELENGAPERSVSGSLGNGTGKWRLTLSSSNTARVMSLLEDPNGYLSNLSENAKLTDGVYQINAMPALDSDQQGFIRITNPNDSVATAISEQNLSYEVTATPEFADSVTALELGHEQGVFLNGVKIDLFAAACLGVQNEAIGCGANTVAEEDEWRFDPMFAENGFGTDSHNAHTQPSGAYHYHGSPNALFDQTGTVESGVIGFASDGFPIFGSYINDGGTIRKATSSYQLKSGNRPVIDVGGSSAQYSQQPYNGAFRQDYEYVEDSGDLDECNGMTRDGIYGYYVTDGYPYIVGCLKGTPDSSFIP